MNGGLRGERAGFVLLVLLLLWAPIPLGSNRPWSASLLACALLLGVGALLLANLGRGDAIAERVVGARTSLALLLAWVVLAFVQLAPLPPSLLEVLSPGALAHWRALGADTLTPLSVDPGATLVDGLGAAAQLALLLLVLLLANSWRRLMLLAVAIVLAGTLQALLGVAAALALQAGWLVQGPVEGVGGVSGTFVNPNHFAGFVEMALALSVGLSLLRPQLRAPAHTGSSSAISSHDASMSRRLALAGAQVLMLAAIFWSGSRGALLAIVVALIVGLLIASVGRPTRGAVTTMMTLVVALAIGFALWGAGTMQTKLESRGLAGNRAAVFDTSSRAAGDYLLTGAGAGTFSRVFPAYKRASLDMRHYEHAHNDYLEELIERGVIGLVLLGSAVALMLGRITLRLRERHGRRSRALLSGVLIGVLALLIHSIYDFNLQIPSNACYFVTLLGIGLKAAALPGEGTVRYPLTG